MLTHKHMHIDHIFQRKGVLFFFHFLTARKTKLDYRLVVQLANRHCFDQQPLLLLLQKFTKIIVWFLLKEKFVIVICLLLLLLLFCFVLSARRTVKAKVKLKPWQPLPSTQNDFSPSVETIYTSLGVANFWARKTNKLAKQQHKTCWYYMVIAGLETLLAVGKAYLKFLLKLEAHTILNSLDSNKETLWRGLIVCITEEKVETVMTFEPTECCVLVQQAVHLHIILCKVLTCVQVGESIFCLHTVTCGTST